jgi:hypothetical protein
MPAHARSTAAAALALVAACGTPPRDTVRDTVRDTAPAAAAPSEADALRTAAGRVRRDGDTLRVALAGGGMATLVDHAVDDADYLRHTYLGALRGAPFHLIRLSRPEERAYLLVHAGTGRRLEVDAAPEVSPDGARLVTASMDLAAAFDPTRLVVWRLAGPARDTAEREIAAEPEGWGPSDARWRGPDTVAFTAHHIVPGDPGATRPAPGLLVRADGGWRLRAP